MPGKNQPFFDFFLKTAEFFRQRMLFLEATKKINYRGYNNCGGVALWRGVVLRTGEGDGTLILEREVCAEMGRFCSWLVLNG